MAENLSNDTNEIRDEMDHHYHENKSLGMMCPYLAGCDVPMRMYPLYPAKDMKGMMHHHKDLIETVQECEVTCEHMTTMIIDKHNVHMRKKQLKLLRDCADVCTLMAKFLARYSVFSKSLAKFCAIVCETCGNECKKFPDEESQRCAQICFNCAKECKEFAASMM